MWNIILLSVACFYTVHIQAQKTAEARNYYYYQLYESAKEILQQQLKEGKDVSDETWYLLGEIYLKQKHTDSAYLLLQKAERWVAAQSLSKKETPLVMIAKAHLLLDSGDISGARQLMEEALEAGKYKNLPVLLAAANVNIDSKNGDMKWTLELLDRAQSKNKMNAAVYLAKGNSYRKIADGGNAVVNYAKAVELDHTLAEAKYKEGLIYKTQQNETIFLEKFMEAVSLDSVYAPALYQLYAYYFTKDVVKADYYLSAYLRHSDWSVEHLYMEADLFYVSRKYPEAIKTGQAIIDLSGQEVQPRIYKLMAYSFAAAGDSSMALKQMDTYFTMQDTAGVVAKDFVLMARLAEANKGTDKTEVAAWYRKAVAMETVAADKLDYMIVLADLEKELKNKSAEAWWRGEIVKNKPAATNLDIYKWGTALYAAGKYTTADSVFQLYVERYPVQVYGYLWRAKCNAVIDSTMSLGLAVPYYQKLIEVAGSDSLKNKNILLNAYGYLGAYQANIRKDYQGSLEYFNRILALDPANEDALKFTATLKKWIIAGNESN